MANTPIEIREARLGQLIVEYPNRSYSFYNPILKKELGAGMRKKAMLRQIREVRTGLLQRGLDNFPRPKHPLADLPNAPRLRSKDPHIMRGMRSMSRLRSEKWRRHFYVDVKFRKKVTTKKKGMTVKYTSIYLGTYTPLEFRKALYNGQANRKIKDNLRELTGETLPYTVLGFWVAAKGKERV